MLKTGCGSENACKLAFSLTLHYLCLTMSGKAVIESIAGKVERLVGENRRLRGEIERLEIARGKLREENRRLAADSDSLKHRLAVKELAAGFAGGADPGSTENGGTGKLDRHGVKIARARVNRLMREVDRCIALLNKD